MADESRGVVLGDGARDLWRNAEGALPLERERNKARSQRLVQVAGGQRSRILIGVMLSKVSTEL